MRDGRVSYGLWHRADPMQTEPKRGDRAYWRRAGVSLDLGGKLAPDEEGPFGDWKAVRDEYEGKEQPLVFVDFAQVCQLRVELERKAITLQLGGELPSNETQDVIRFSRDHPDLVYEALRVATVLPETLATQAEEPTAQPEVSTIPMDAEDGVDREQWIEPDTTPPGDASAPRGASGVIEAAPEAELQQEETTAQESPDVPIELDAVPPTEAEASTPKEVPPNAIPPPAANEGADPPSSSDESLLDLNKKPLHLPRYTGKEQGFHRASNEEIDACFQYFAEKLGGTIPTEALRSGRMRHWLRKNKQADTSDRAIQQCFYDQESYHRKVGEH
jgi:hypothetical protein